MNTQVILADARTHRFSGACDVLFLDPPQQSGRNSKKWLGPNEFDTFTQQWMKNVLQYIRCPGIVIIHTIPAFTHYYRSWLERELNYWQEVVWDYNFGTYQLSQFVPSHSYFLYYIKGIPSGHLYDWTKVAEISQRIKDGDSRANPLGRNPGSVFHLPRIPGNSRWRVKDSNGDSLPSQLPEPLVRKLLLPVTKKNSLVYDPFAGSGTVAKVCTQICCDSISLDVSPGCIEIMNDRITAGYDYERMMK
jgi:DNA modification methylase